MLVLLLYDCMVVGGGSFTPDLHAVVSDVLRTLDV